MGVQTHLLVVALHLQRVVSPWLQPGMQACPSMGSVPWHMSIVVLDGPQPATTIPITTAINVRMHGSRAGRVPPNPRR
jgi:hypothetical protein